MNKTLNLKNKDLFLLALGSLCNIDSSNTYQEEKTKNTDINKEK